MKKAIALFLIVISIALISCRPDIEVKDEANTESWSELFDAWWKGMSKNYLFWDLDSQNGEWDDVYEKYMPQMESYGAIGGDRDIEAIRVFFDITKNLSDNHFGMRLTNDSEQVLGSKGIRAQFSTLYYDLFLKAGLSDEDAFKWFLSGGDLPNEINQLDAIAERTDAIMYYTFGIKEEGNRAFSDTSDSSLSSYFSKAGYAVNSDRNWISSGSVFLGLSKNNVLYFSFSNFSFPSLYDISKLSVGNDYRGDLITEEKLTFAKAAMALFDEYISLIESRTLNGLIIDLRGNIGGDTYTLPMLWSPLLGEELLAFQFREKLSDNRQSYNIWQDFTFLPYSEKTFDKPIVVLTNSNTASCGETSVMFFKAFRDQFRANVKIFGGRTAGCTGMVGSDNRMQNGGIFAVGDYIPEVYMCSMEVRYRDETSFEVVGIEPDVLVDFNYGLFTTGQDLRLRAADTWINGGILP